MKIPLLISILFALLLPLHAEKVNVHVAKVDYSEIDDLLERVVLNKPENKELGERYFLQKKRSQEQQKKMQEAIMRGEKINPMEAAAGFMNQSEDNEEVENLCQKHLLILMEKLFSSKYDLVFKDGYSSSLLYTKIAVDDVTDLLRQELLKSLPTKEDNRVDGSINSPVPHITGHTGP